MHEFGEWVYPKEREDIFEKMDYVALGHWHGFGSVGKHPNVYYAGSTERTSSSDKREDKGYILLDVSEALALSHHTITLRKSLSFGIDADNYEEEIEALDLSEIKNALVEVKLFNLTVSSSIDITNKALNEIFEDALYVKVKREFKEVEGEKIEGDIESISLETYFISHIKESVTDEVEQERLTAKAKELFALYEEADDDTH